MIILTIVLSVAGVVIAALASIAIAVIRRNSRLARNLEEAHVGKAALKRENSRLQYELTLREGIIGGIGRERDELNAQNADLSEALERTRVIYNKLLQENAALNARNTALVEAMEARPTQPKRTVRKNSTAGEQQ